MSVLTPTIAGREHLLAENIASVKAQTFRRFEHLILLDDERQGCAVTVNALAREATGDWLFILGDDDLVLPRCLELHVAAAGPAPITYAPPLVWGESPDQFWAAPPNIPAVALIRRDFWEQMGGYDESRGAAEDNEFWRRAEERTAQFVRYGDAPTWIYRFHSGNKSRG